MRIYTTAPIVTNNDGHYLTCIMLSANDAQYFTANSMSWRIKFNSFSYSGSPDAPSWFDSSFSTLGGINYGSYEGNGQSSPPISEWPVNPAPIEYTNGHASTSEGRSSGITLRMGYSPGDAASCEFDIEIEAFADGAWVPLDTLLEDPVFVMGGDEELGFLTNPPGEFGYDRLASSEIVVEYNSDPVPVCFWTDVLGAEQECGEAPTGVFVDALLTYSFDDLTWFGDVKYTPPGPYESYPPFTIASLSQLDASLAPGSSGFNLHDDVVNTIAPGMSTETWGSFGNVFALQNVSVDLDFAQALPDWRAGLPAGLVMPGTVGSFYLFAGGQIASRSENATATRLTLSAVFGESSVGEFFYDGGNTTGTQNGDTGVPVDWRWQISFPSDTPYEQPVQQVQLGAYSAYNGMSTPYPEEVEIFFSLAFQFYIPPVAYVDAYIDDILYFGNDVYVDDDTGELLPVYDEPLPTPTPIPDLALPVYENAWFDAPNSSPAPADWSYGYDLSTSPLYNQQGLYVGTLRTREGLALAKIALSVLLG